MAPPNSGPWSGKRLGGRYRLGMLLGQGAAGSVYEATLEGEGTHVAVVLLRPHLAASDPALGRFEREARAASELGHPGIVRFLDLVRLSGEPVLVALEHLEGASLKELLQQRWVLPEERVARIGAQALEALHSAHRAGILHRSLRPSSLFVVEGSETVKLLDFGIAALAEGKGGLGPGHPLYLAPERPTGPGADLYALGVILREALQGRASYDARTPASQLYPDRLPRSGPADLALAGVLGRATSADPSLRFRDAAQMRSALSPFVRGPIADLPDAPAPAADVPELATPPAVPSEERRRRRWNPAIVAGGLLAAATAGVLLYWAASPEATQGPVPPVPSRAETRLQQVAAEKPGLAAVTAPTAVPKPSQASAPPPPPAPAPAQVVAPPRRAPAPKPRRAGGATTKLTLMTTDLYDPAWVDRRLIAIAAKVDACFAAAARAGISEGGWRVTLGADGIATSVEPIGTSPRSKVLDRCMRPVLHWTRWGKTREKRKGTIDLHFAAPPRATRKSKAAPLRAEVPPSR